MTHNLKTFGINNTHKVATFNGKEYRFLYHVFNPKIVLRWLETHSHHQYLWILSFPQIITSNNEPYFSGLVNTSHKNFNQVLKYMDTLRIHPMIKTLELSVTDSTDGFILNTTMDDDDSFVLLKLKYADQ
jgi:hypothetical protein